MAGRHGGPLHLWQLRRCARPHIYPDGVAQLTHGVGVQADLVFEVTLGGLAGHVDTRTRGVELPAVVDAAQAAFFVAAEEQRRTPVRTKGADCANLAVGIAKDHQVFAEKSQARWIAVTLG